MSMHKFLKSIGFSDMKRRDVEMLLTELIRHPDTIKASTDSEGAEYVELSCQYGPGFGIMIRGTYNERDEFQMDYYYPFLEPYQMSTEEFVDIEKHAEKESYAGVCDDYRLGVTLIFYLQNVVDYLAEQKLRGPKERRRGAMLSALASEGKIVLPVQNGKEDVIVELQKRLEYNKLMSQARDGNEEAIANLALEDMDTYAMLSQRVEKEDLLSIISSTFMPYGIESDQYSIIGEISAVVEAENRISHEKIYILGILCNDMVFDICINAKDLFGKPEIGRRFKGNIWMQGKIVS